jgi:hypothetical protein
MCLYLALVDEYLQRPKHFGHLMEIFSVTNISKINCGQISISITPSYMLICSCSAILYSSHTSILNRQSHSRYQVGKESTGLKPP